MAEEAAAAVNASVSPATISTRFVPDALHWDGTAWKLRGALVLLPQPNESVRIDVWIDAVAQALGGGLELDIAPDPGLADWDGSGAQSCPAHVLYDRTSDAVQAPLWQSLMTYSPVTGIRSDVLAILKLGHGDAKLHDAMKRSGSISGGSALFGDRPGFTRDALDLANHGGFAPNPSGGIRVAAAGTSALANALVQTGGARLVNGLNASILSAQALDGVQTMSVTSPAKPALAEVQNLFMGSLQNQQVRAYGGKLDAPQLAASIGTLLAGRGAAAATQAERNQHNVVRACEAHNPLTRVPPIKGPEIRATDAVVAELGKILASDADLANKRATHGRGAPRLAAPRIGATEALVRHMLALCPDPEITAPAVEYLAADETMQNMSARSAAGLYRALKSLSDQRVAGLLSYPTLARALRLVVDVEADLGSLPAVVQSGLDGASRFVVAGVFGTTTDTKLWSRCQLIKGQFTLVGEDELASQPTNLSEHVAGFYNLACQYEDGSGALVPRFQATSIDVVAKAEQLVTKAKSDAAKMSSGSDDEDGSGNTRTVGVSILDALRSSTVQQEASRAKTLEGDINSPGKAVILQAEDLTAGICLDVGVDRKDGRGCTWRSLMRRSLRYGKVKTSVGTVDVEDLVRRTVAAAAPQVKGLPQAEAFRRRLEECSYKAPTRIMPTKPTQFDKDVDDAAAIALEAIGHWEGDPLGAPALQPGSDTTAVDTEDGSAAHEFVLDEVLAMPLAIDLDVPSGMAGLTPPRMEIGRKFYFAARASYLGGLGLSPDDLDKLYGTGSSPLSISVGSTGTLERHERIGAPMVAEIFPVAPKGASDSQVHLIIRSGGGPLTSRGSARRIFMAPGVHQAYAAMHRHPTIAGRRALDTDILLGKRAAGGLVNVALDPENGGLQVLYRGAVIPRRDVPKPKQDAAARAAGKPDRARATEPPAMGVFSVSETDVDDLEARKVPYFPDPMVLSFALQLWTQGNSARPIRKPVMVGVYDDRYRVDLPSDWDLPAGLDHSIYPFALPLVVEIVKGDTLNIEDIETGYLNDAGTFRALSQDRPPPSGTVTCRRVRVSLPPTADVDLKVWCVPASNALPWLSQVNEAIDIDPSRSVKGIYSTLSSVPVSDLAEVRTVSLTHTIERPATPVIKSAKVVRADMTQEAWTKRVGDPAFDFDRIESEAMATTTWLGGEYVVDPAASDITLGVSFQDVRDVPGVPFALDKSGEPIFEWKVSEQIVKPLEQTDADHLRPIITAYLEAVDHRPRNMVITGFDTRSYRIRLAPSSTSRFISQIVEMKPDNLERFSSNGAPYELIIPATDRPAPMGRVRMLPAFVWTEKQSGVLRRAVVRLSWRRPRVSSKAQAQTIDTTGCWYSSGEGELLGVVLATAGHHGDDYGPQRDYISAWGADPIRSNAIRTDRPSDGFGSQNIVLGDRELVQAEMPPVTNPEDAGLSRPPQAYRTDVDLATYMPKYDPVQDAWWVDVDIEPGRAATPYVRLGLVRYQPNAIDGMHVSQPSHIGFALVPKRSLEVVVLPRDRATKLWPIRVVVRGPFGVIDGDAGAKGAALERITSAVRPTFKLVVSRDKSIFGGGEEPIVQTDSDGAPPPIGDILWETTLLLPHNPRGLRHHVFVEEVDLMLPANPELYEDGEVLETGPRFMARVAVE